MVGIFKLEEILDIREEIAEVRMRFRDGRLPPMVAVDILMDRHGYGLGDALTILIGTRNHESDDRSA